jgi:hypothetical protein
VALSGEVGAKMENRRLEGLWMEGWIEGWMDNGRTEGL